MPKIVLQPSGKTLEAPRKANLLRFLQQHQIPVGGACGGHGICASCKIIVLKGERNLSRPNDLEQSLAERNHLMNNERISCQAKILGDIEITTSYWNEGSFDDEEIKA